MSAKSEKGLLILGARPIGDYKDSSLKLIEYIKSVDVIMVENLFVFQELLDELQMTTDAEVIDINVSKFFMNGLVVDQGDLNKNMQMHIQIAGDKVKEGKTVLLLSDEGSACIIDPGVGFINFFKRNNLPYKAMAGPSALALAAGVSTLVDVKFTFIGMIQDDRNPQASFEMIRDSKNPTIAYLRTKNDFVEFMENMCQVVGENRLATFCLNMTTEYEIIIEDTLVNIIGNIKNNRYNGGIAMVIGEFGRERKNV